jgi:hypothetical protein
MADVLSGALHEETGMRQRSAGPARRGKAAQPSAQQREGAAIRITHLIEAQKMHDEQEDRYPNDGKKRDEFDDQLPLFVPTKASELRCFGAETRKVSQREVGPRLFPLGPQTLIERTALRKGGQIISLRFTRAWIATIKNRSGGFNGTNGAAVRKGNAEQQSEVGRVSP